MTPAGTFNELDVQNKWEENTHTQNRGEKMRRQIAAAVERICHDPDFYEIICILICLGQVTDCLIG